jgi:plastocyanin
MTDEAVTSAGRLAARWTRTASLGLLLSAGGSLVLVAAILAFGVSSEGGPWFGLVFTMIPLIGGLLVNGEEPRWKVVGIISSFLTAGALFWTAFGLSRPSSFFDFVPAVLVLPGALIGLGASIATLLRRDRLTAADDRPERTWIRTMLVVAAAAVGLSSLLTVVSRKSADLAKANAAVRMADFEFDGASYDWLGDTTVYVRNDDPFFHTFTVDELGIDVDLSPGSAALVRIPARPGTYLLYCRPHADKDDPVDKGMAASLRIR